MNVYTPVRGAMLQAYYIPLRVKPMPRPRVVGTRVWVPDTTSDLAKAFDEKRFGSALECPVFVDCHFHFTAPAKGGVWPVSQTIGDLDNLTKSVADALVKGAILQDDRWIIGGESTKIFTSEDYLYVFIYSVSDEIECRRVGHVI
jgi:Holliday junction resolvase RusA-like endonuclease